MEDTNKGQDTFELKHNEFINENWAPTPNDPFNFASRPASWHREASRKLLRKIDLHLLPMLSLMFLMCYLDRSNLAQARLAGLDTDLKLHGDQFNTATSLLFVGYLLMVCPMALIGIGVYEVNALVQQLPSNLILTRMRPSIFLPWAIRGSHSHL